MFKKVYSLYSAFYPSLRFTLSLQSAFYTQSAFYPWSAVCSLQSAVCVLHWPIEQFSTQSYTSSLCTTYAGFRNEDAVNESAPYPELQEGSPDSNPDGRA